MLCHTILDNSRVDLVTTNQRPSTVEVLSIFVLSDSSLRSLSSWFYGFGTGLRVVTTPRLQSIDGAATPVRRPTFHLGPVRIPCVDFSLYRPLPPLRLVPLPFGFRPPVALKHPSCKTTHPLKEFRDNWLGSFVR